MSTSHPANEDLQVEVITDAADFEQAYECVANAFGHQTHDGIWILMNPSWDLPEGRAKGIAALRERWQATKDAGNTIFLKATLPDPATPPGAAEGRVVAGMAIWVNASAVPGQGEVPQEMDFGALYPDDESMQRYLRQAMGSLHKHRLQVLKQKAEEPDSKHKSVMVLDLCATDPKYQGRGAASKLVQWGLDDAKRRGGLEATTEASAMGRRVYKKLGFREVKDIVYDVDEEFRDRPMPSNVFMRTGPLA